MTTTLQPFKATDLIEPRMRDCALPTLAALGTARDSFYSGANEAYPLGDVLYALNRDPMANGVLTLAVYRRSFFAIHEIFTRAGTYEFYLEVFRAIWGDDVTVEFIPTPGKLHINIGGLDLQDFNLSFREIVADAYVYSKAVDETGAYLIVRDSIGTKNQSEVDALIAEISPAGIYVTATLTV